MRGTYRGEERGVHRELWRKTQIPYFIKHEIEPIAQFISRKTGILAIDGGANKGFWSKALLTRFPGQVARILAIDASPENYAELRNKDDNLIFDPEDFSYVVPVHCALGAEAGEVDLFTDEEGSPLASVFQHVVGGENTLGTMGALDNVVRVPRHTIDDIVSILGINRIDILKLDLEGSELNALRGAEKTFAAGRIGIVVFEFGVHQVDARHFFRDFWEFFHRHGFSLIKVAEDGNLYKIAKYGYHMENFTWCWNFIATMPDARASKSPPLEGSCMT